MGPMVRTAHPLLITQLLQASTAHNTTASKLVTQLLQASKQAEEPRNPIVVGTTVHNHHTCTVSFATLGGASFAIGKQAIHHLCLHLACTPKASVADDELSRCPPVQISQPMSSSTIQHIGVSCEPSGQSAYPGSRRVTRNREPRSARVSASWFVIESGL